ncbi:alkyl sulfatase BDS1-like metallo-beta-lactamase superfamily hydrolase [Paraburkholderia sp. GAS41]|uniref:twin-arginine translocation signal domain-containing protein n=1 Tax=Paraburkholderia sp. GAS41 TaxID=3035134 RepID=UPI003D263A0B
MADDTNSKSAGKRRDFLKGVATVGVAAGVGVVTGDGFAQTGASARPSEIGAKPPTDATRQANALYANQLPFNDTTDFEDAKRGLIATLPEPGVIPSSKGGAA